MEPLTLSGKTETTKISQTEIASPFIIVKNIPSESGNEDLSLLSEEEHVKYFEIQDTKRKSQFYWGRYYLRYYLSDIMPYPLPLIPLKTDASGKPYVADNTCYVSLTHSHDKLGLVISPSPCGIDIEKISPREHIQAIMNKMFTQNDVHEIQNHSTPLPEFYKKWTLHEALFKMNQNLGHLDEEKKEQLKVTTHSQILEDFALSYVFVDANSPF